VEPQIRYVRSADGTKIALSTFGEGQPLVWMGSIGFSSMDLQWRLPSREGIERLAETRMVVRYDNSGQGLSDRDVSDFSLEARVSDLAAVTEAAAQEAGGLGTGGGTANRR